MKITCPEGQEFVFSDDNQSGECDWVLCTDWYTNHAMIIHINRIEYELKENSKATVKRPGTGILIENSWRHCPLVMV